MTLDRLLVLLLSLSFLLLAPPAAANDHAPPAGIALNAPTGQDEEPLPVLPPDDAGPILLTTAPEAPSPAGTGDAGGLDDLLLPVAAALSCHPHAPIDIFPLRANPAPQSCVRPWSTGPPRA
ncbi:hypothetical protein [Niveispirillum sp.]|uniref:hypothetical protein n=1 Tax=Niveispirillum sp. TaxID=1917217 RepID=UPI001B798C39|nr:hypothetical protein [Niveispirillum sp.]MBP7335563.1 hypothetical protein [Niveispirillum sp.]